ncbi:MAG: glycosyltransferase family 2 protein [Psychromonas sp.]|nr:glycosyltransferase family 2 protein [Psychromonas sp.]
MSKETRLFNPLFLIPCFNHGPTLEGVVEKLQQQYDYPILIVDDASDCNTKHYISRLESICHIITLANNTGKGGAVIEGIEHAHRLGYSHAIQIDADGQHDLNVLINLVTQSKAHQNSLISGCPVFDESISRRRFYGRYLTHFLVWIETLSLSIKDTMCGFRVYPIPQMVALFSQYKFGKRMEFDIEVMVRFYWNDGDIRFVDTKVIYPKNGLSHFDFLQDNIKISQMHIKLIFAMLPRIPALLSRNKRLKRQGGKKPQKHRHWSRMQERGTYYGLKMLVLTYSVFGRSVFKFFLAPVVFYFAISATRIKQSSKGYFNKLRQYALATGITIPANLTVYQHINSFSLTLLDKFAAWNGDIAQNRLIVHGREDVQTIVKNKKGIILIGSHLGNLELCRALSKRYLGVKVTALMFTKHSSNFTRTLKAVNANSELNIIQVDKLGSDTAILLHQKIEAGEWIVIVGDRTSASVETRAVWVDFLGQKAPFPQGPFLLASILKAPVYTLFALRNESRKELFFDLYFEFFSDQIKLVRDKREQELERVVQQYANRLQAYAIQAPLQWYNFYDFWCLSGERSKQ